MNVQFTPGGVVPYHCQYLIAFYEFLLWPPKYS